MMVGVLMVEMGSFLPVSLAPFSLSPFLFLSLGWGRGGSAFLLSFLGGAVLLLLYL